MHCWLISPNKLNLLPWFLTYLCDKYNALITSTFIKCTSQGSSIWNFFRSVKETMKLYVLNEDHESYCICMRHPRHIFTRFNTTPYYDVVQLHNCDVVLCMWVGGGMEERVYEWLMPSIVNFHHVIVLTIHNLWRHNKC